MDDGKLPPGDHSNVVRKLQEFGIDGPIEFAGVLIEESAQASINLPSHMPPDVQVFLQKAEFPGGKSEFQLAIGYEDNKDGAEKILDAILAANEIDRELVTKGNVEKFFEIIDAYAK